MSVTTVVSKNESMAANTVMREVLESAIFRRIVQCGETKGFIVIILANVTGTVQNITWTQT